MYCRNVVEPKSQPIMLTTLVEPGKVYKCISEIVCANGRFTKDSLVMLRVNYDKTDVLELADFIPICKNSIDIAEIAYGFSLADKESVDAFKCKSSRFSEYFEEAGELNKKIEGNSKHIEKLRDGFTLGCGIVATIAILVLTLLIFTFNPSWTTLLILVALILGDACCFAVSLKMIRLYERHIKRKLYVSLAK